MSIDARSGTEAVLAMSSVIIGIAGAALVEPIILGVAAAGAVIATAMRLYDKSQKPSPTTTAGKVKIAV